MKIADDKNIYKAIKILYNYSVNDKTFIAQIKFLSRKGGRKSPAWGAKSILTPGWCVVRRMRV